MKRAEQVVLVTGAAQGIGLGVARRFLAEGARVVLADVSEQALEDTRTTLKKQFERFMTLRADVSCEDQVQFLIQRASERFGPVNVLVNNAGISPKHAGVKAPVRSMSSEEWSRVIDVNLKSAFLCTKLCLPGMIERKWGRIVNIASQAGRTRSDVAGAHYAASKAGMMALARTVGCEEGLSGVTVNSIAPGRIDTPMARVAGEQLNDEYKKRIPVGRLGTVDDIAAAALFLASDEAGFITGVTLDVNGGNFMI